VGIMPPHCDSLDGPVVAAARRALDAGDVDLVLPFVPEQGEAELREAFQSVLRVRELSDDAREVADRLFFETAVRVHRAGEGAPYTGLKPAGLSFGPVIPLAESAVESGSAEPVADFLCHELERQLRRRLDEVNMLGAGKGRLCRMPGTTLRRCWDSRCTAIGFIRGCRRRHITGMAALKVHLPSRASIRHRRRWLRPTAYPRSRAVLW